MTTTQDLAIGDHFTREMPDGSTVKALRTAPTVVLVSRSVGPTVVWGQAFTPEAVERVITSIVDNPAAFVR